MATLASARRQQSCGTWIAGVAIVGGASQVGFEIVIVSERKLHQAARQADGRREQIAHARTGRIGRGDRIGNGDQHLPILCGQLTDELARLTCPACGIKYMEFRSEGRLGCPHDYQVFRTGLEPLLNKIHRADRHVGKRPRRPWTTRAPG